MLTKVERLLVLTGMDFSEKDDLYLHAMQLLKKFKGKVSVNSSSLSSEIK